MADVRTLALTEGKQSEGKRIAERSDGKIIKAIAMAIAMAGRVGKSGTKILTKIRHFIG